jgi:hypothetical protein
MTRPQYIELFAPISEQRPLARNPLTGEQTLDAIDVSAGRALAWFASRSSDRTVDEACAERPVWRDV